MILDIFKHGSRYEFQCDFTFFYIRLFVHNLTGQKPTVQLHYQSTFISVAEPKHREAVFFNRHFERPGNIKYDVISTIRGASACEYLFRVFWHNSWNSLCFRAFFSSRQTRGKFVSFDTIQYSTIQEFVHLRLWMSRVNIEINVFSSSFLTIGGPGVHSTQNNLKCWLCFGNWKNIASANPISILSVEWRK